MGDLCRVDAARLAAPGDAAAARGVLAGLAGARPRWHAVQPDQHAANHRTTHESADPPRARGVRQADDRGLLEVGLHNPLAAAIGRHGESEWALAQRLLAQLPKRALLFGDRLYGVAAFVVHARAACTRVGSHFLLRASAIDQAPIAQTLARWDAPGPDCASRAAQPTSILEWLELREIRVRVGRPGHRPHELRLWTSLVDPRTAPALELAQLYAQRWEHELYFRELKRQVRRTDVLHSHTVETAAQEIAALVLVSALLAAERRRAAGGQLPVLRVSFTKSWSSASNRCGCASTWATAF